MSSDESREGSVTINPEQMGRLGRMRAAQAKARQKGYAVPDQPAERWRATCPWCHAPNVIMSDFAPGHARTSPPAKGDVIQCDACRRLHGVFKVEGFIVRTSKVEVDYGQGLG